MQDDATPPVPSGAVPDAPALDPAAVEAVLGEFRQWLQNLPGAGAGPAEASPAAEEIDLHTLVAQFTALRHEVNLQTRASRSQLEQNLETLRYLAEAVDTLQQARPEPPRANGGDRERALLKALVDVYDALALAGREVRRVEEALAPALEDLERLPWKCRDAFAAAQPAPSFLARILGRGQPPKGAADPVADAAAEVAAGLADAADRVRGLITSILTGYTMSVQRVERALQQADLEPIAAVGAPFDPEQMEAVEVVVEPGRESTEVIEEVRRGYLWQGKVFRYAQVRVARPEPRGP